MEVEIKEYNDLKFMNSLPKFSVVRLEKMKKFAEKEALSIRPLRPWDGQQTTTSTSRTAFGHRRNGGGQKPPNLAQMNSPAYIAKQRARHNLQNLNNKKKNEIETSEREVLMVRLNAQKALYLLDIASMKGADVEVVSVNTEDIVTAEKIAEWQEFRNEEIELFNAKVNSADFDANKYEPSTKVFTPKVTPNVVKPEWVTIDRNKVYRDKLSKECIKELYANTFYQDPSKIDPIKIMAVPWQESKTGTLMCLSVAKRQKCMHVRNGRRCNFAHSVEELNPKNCVNEKCIFVQQIGDKYVNRKGNKICAYLHEGEVKSNLCLRIGVKPVVKKVVVCEVICEKQSLWVTPMGNKVLRRYSSELAWGPII
jgi:hypothetical protein